MPEFIQSVLNNIVVSLSATILAAVVLFFPLLAGVAFTAAVVKLLKADVDIKATALYGIVFGVFGLSVAYISTMSQADILAKVIPPAIAGVIVLFQLLGRLNPKWDVPLETQASLVGATAGVFCFIFGSIYFQAAPLQTHSIGSGSGFIAPEDPLADDDIDQAEDATSVDEQDTSVEEADRIINGN